MEICTLPFFQEPNVGTVPFLCHDYEKYESKSNIILHIFTTSFEKEPNIKIYFVQIF